MLRKAIVGALFILSGIFMDDRTRMYPRLVVCLGLSEPPTACVPLTRTVLERAERHAASVRMHGGLCPAAQWETPGGGVVYCDD